MEAYKVASIAKHNANQWIRFAAIDLLTYGVCHIHPNDFGNNSIECEKVCALFTEAGAVNHGIAMWEGVGDLTYAITAD